VMQLLEPPPCQVLPFSWFFLPTSHTGKLTG
jgi:hypothetical protein